MAYMNKLFSTLFVLGNFLLLSACNRPDVGKLSDLKDMKFSYPSPRYQLIPGGVNSAWKIDTQEGTVWFCAAGTGQVVCGEATKFIPKN